VASVNKVAKEQIAFLTYASACGNLVYTFSWVTNVTGRPFWIAVLLGVLANIPFAVWIMYLGQLYQGDTIFDILEKVLGKFFSKILIILYIILNSIIAACLLNMFTGSVKTFFLFYTPSWIIMLFIVFICAMFVNSEIQVLGRFVEILVVVYTINYFIGFSFSFFKDFKIQKILPIFDTTFIGFAKGFLISAGSTAECLFFLMVLVGSVSEPYKNSKSVVKALAYWSAVLSSAILIMSGVMSPELLSRVAGAGISVSKVIQVGEFIRGLEILILITYQLLTIAKVSLYIYSSWVSARILFNSRKSLLQLILVSLIVFLLSAWINSFNTGYFLSVFLGSYILLPFSVIILLLAALGTLLQKSRTGSGTK